MPDSELDVHLHAPCNARGSAELIFIPPAVTLQRRILIFWFGPWRDFMNVSNRARGV